MSGGSYCDLVYALGLLFDSMMFRTMFCLASKAHVVIGSCRFAIRMILVFGTRASVNLSRLGDAGKIVTRRWLLEYIVIARARVNDEREKGKRRSERERERG